MDNSQPSATVSAPAPHVLVVDDDAPILRALTARLKHAGFCVKSARDGASALTQVEDTAPQVALLDVRMPGLDGFKLAGEIRRRAPECQLIFLTASKEPDLPARVGAFEGALMMEKPFSSEALVEAIESRLCLAS